MRILTALLLVLWLISCRHDTASHSDVVDSNILASTEANYRKPPPGNRQTVLISDLHMGVGRTASGDWYKTEDFRWPDALRSFLTMIGKPTNNNVDLLIVGDFLELWQPTKQLACKGYDADNDQAIDLHCTVDEMAKIAAYVIGKHSKEITALKNFSQKGENRIHILPGNHDSTLRLAKVWKPLGEKLQASKGRINLVSGGVFVSKDRNGRDGRVVVEHGHQIGEDVNKYDHWPKITGLGKDGKRYVIRPWGELFVQKMFNKEEENNYSIIDNIGPESAGARFRMADRGLVETAGDLAKFIAFNLFETSSQQLHAFLGLPPKDDQGRSIWDPKIGREKRHELFVNALPPKDPFRKVLLDPNSSKSKMLRQELDRWAQKIPTSQVLSLCDKIALHGYGTEKQCFDSRLGNISQKLFNSKTEILRSHLNTRIQKYPNMTVFIYGHTHEFELPWTVTTKDGDVTIANTGAFQRIVDEAGYLLRIRKKSAKERRYISPGEGLRVLRHKDLPPCYTYVILKMEAGLPFPEVKRWYKPDGKPGRPVAPLSPRCK